MPTPSKFTATTRETILEVKRVGGPDTLACAAAKISDETLRRWLEKGKGADEGSYRDFYDAYHEAKAHPQVRALGLLYKKLPDSDPMLWKYVERQVKGFAPPAPVAPSGPQGPIIIQLALADGRPASPGSTVIEVGDEQNVKSIPASTD